MGTFMLARGMVRILSIAFLRNFQAYFIRKRQVEAREYSEYFYVRDIGNDPEDNDVLIPDIKTRP